MPDPRLKRSPAATKMTFHNAQDITSTTANNGTSFSMEGYEKLNLDVSITTTGSPQRIRLKIQTRVDSNDSWKDYTYGFAQAMYWNDDAAPIAESVPIPGEICEEEVRVVAEAEGTVDGSNYWTITIKGRPYTMR